MDAALATVTDLYDEVLALYADEGTGGAADRVGGDEPGARADAAGARGRRRGHPGRAVCRAALAAAEAAVREVLALVEGCGGEDVRLAARAAEARAMLAELAALGGTRGGRRSCSGPSTRTWRRDCRGSRSSTRCRSPPWPTRPVTWPGPSGRCGRPWSTGGPYVEPIGRAQLHLQLAEVLGGRDAPEEAAEHALQAAHWADEAGESGTLGAWQPAWAASAAPGPVRGGRRGAGVRAGRPGGRDAPVTGWSAGPLVARGLPGRAGRAPGRRRAAAQGRRPGPALARAAGPRHARPSRRRVAGQRRTGGGGGPGLRARGRAVALARQRPVPGPLAARPRLAGAGRGVRGRRRPAR
ncbi:hypothetical protein LT493_19175 [Streptomyces tricolor]|nr:hypothetical protein [Streptomyces tricolor]